MPDPEILAITGENALTHELLVAARIVDQIGETAPASLVNTTLRPDYTRRLFLNLGENDNDYVQFESTVERPPTVVPYVGYLLRVWQPRGARTPLRAMVLYGPADEYTEEWKIKPGAGTPPKDRPMKFGDMINGKILGPIEPLKLAMVRDVTLALIDHTKLGIRAGGVRARQG